jgi:Cd(II)/Pb(II)-responsive transcriptional regulator
MVNTRNVGSLEEHNMRIGELAERAVIKVDTVRYYEKAGLLPLPPRRPNGYRDYGTGHLERLAFIRHCRALDMPLDDVRQLLDLLAHPSEDCQDANRLVDEQLARVQERISDLRTLEKQLQSLRTQCTSKTSSAECGILHELVAAAQGGGCVCHPRERDKRGKTREPV